MQGLKVAMGLLLTAGVLLTNVSVAKAAHHHAQHNMVLYGETEVFASHIVYKSPHNYQVILSLDFDPSDLKEYSDAKAASPSSQFIYLLDHMNIGEINSAKDIRGVVFYRDSDGNKVVVLPELILARDQFRVIFFAELPLSLAK